MSAVDVLAVMDAYSVPGQICCGMPMGGGCDENGNMEAPICCGQPFTESDMQAARAAVAELIEAGLEYDEAERGLSRNGDGPLSKRMARYNAAQKRRDAALARCKGEQA